MEQPLVTASVTVQQGDPTLPLSYKAVQGPLSTSQYSLHVTNDGHSALLLLWE